MASIAILHDVVLTLDQVSKFFSLDVRNRLPPTVRQVVISARIKAPLNVEWMLSGSLWRFVPFRMVRRVFPLARQVREGNQAQQLVTRAVT